MYCTYNYTQFMYDAVLLNCMCAFSLLCISLCKEVWVSDIVDAQYYIVTTGKLILISIGISTAN